MESRLTSGYLSECPNDPRGHDIEPQTTSDYLSECPSETPGAIRSLIRCFNALSSGNPLSTFLSHINVEEPDVSCSFGSSNNHTLKRPAGVGAGAATNDMVLIIGEGNVIDSSVATQVARCNLNKGF